jgi:hypothetical protein
MPQIEGSYTRQASGKRYGYLLTYGVRGKVLSWMGAVHAGAGIEGAVRGHPEGEVSFELPPLEEEQQRVARERLEEAIEALRGVQE